MTPSFHFTFSISPLALIDHLSFFKWLMVNVKLLKIDNCKLIIASSRGACA